MELKKKLCGSGEGQKNTERGHKNVHGEYKRHLSKELCPHAPE